MFRKYLGAAAAAFLVVLAAGSLPASAAGPKVSKAVATPMSEAQTLAKAGDFNGALAKVKEAQALSDKTSYDDYVIANFLGYVAINLKDYKLATQAYEAMAASPDLPEADRKSTLHNAVLLEDTQQQYAKVLEYSKQLEAAGGMDDKTYAAAAKAAYFTSDMTNAQAYAQKSIDLAKAAGQQPQQAALEIVMSTSAKANNQQGAQQALEQLVATYNDPDNWSKLIDVAFGQGGLERIDEFYLARLRMRVGAMQDGGDYTVLANLAMQLGYPAEQRETLLAGIAKGKLTNGTATGLAKARTDAAADERALPMLAKSAAASKAGEQDVKLAETYYGYGRYADAEASARSAIAKGGMKDPSEGNMILGEALIAQGKSAEALGIFNQVAGGASRKKVAHLWSLYAQASNKPAAPAPAAAAQ